jgi:VanZ family protein
MKRTAVFFTLLIIVIVILADTGSLPRFLDSIYDFPNGDKVGHFILFGLLNFFITRAVLSALPSRPSIWVTFSIGLILALLVAAEEYSQSFFPKRTPDWIDLLASYLGVFIGGYAALKVKRKSDCQFDL